MYFLLFLSFFIIACNSNSTSSTVSVQKDSVVPVTDTTVPILTIDSYILENHNILAQKTGDFNMDGFEDVVLILKQTEEETISDYANETPSLRPLLFLTGDQKGSLHLVARNDSAVYCWDCGGQMGDPFNDLSIDGPFVSISYYGGSQTRWTRNVTFKYDAINKTWFLHQDGEASFQATAPIDTPKISTKSNSIAFEDFNIYD